MLHHFYYIFFYTIDAWCSNAVKVDEQSFSKIIIMFVFIVVYFIYIVFFIFSLSKKVFKA